MRYFDESHPIHTTISGWHLRRIDFFAREYS